MAPLLSMFVRLFVSLSLQVSNSPRATMASVGKKTRSGTTPGEEVCVFDWVVCLLCVYIRLYVCIYVCAIHVLIVSSLVPQFVPKKGADARAEEEEEVQDSVSD